MEKKIKANESMTTQESIEVRCLVVFTPSVFCLRLVCFYAKDAQTAILALQSVVGSDLKPKEIELALVSTADRKYVVPACQLWPPVTCMT